MTKLFKIIKYFIALTVLAFVSINFWISSTTENQVIDSLDEIPNKKVALILGTSKKMIGGADNQFFHKRIAAAAQLYHLGKVKHILVSGDNRTQYYNEPQDMYEALLELMVPADAITKDYAGLRTLDSVVRCKEIFGQESVVIITQRFHAHRALFIANHYDLDAISYPAEFPEHEGATKVVLREYFARIKAVLDLYFFKTPPKHLGDREKIDV